MAFVLADRVKESCAAPGTGTVTLLGAATGYQSFSAGIGANNTTYYTIADQGGANWEVGYGTIGAGGTTLARTTVLASSNSGSLVNFSSGTQDVFCDYPATKAALADSANALRVDGQSYVNFESAPGTTVAAGRMWYDNTLGNWNLGMGGGNITQQVGEELFVYGKASAAITDSPLQCVYQTGTVGASGVITFAPTVAGITDGEAIVGVATENIALNGFGRVTAFGVVHGITTNGAAYGETWADGDKIWYNPVTGGLTKTKPVAPNIKVQVGIVINAGSGGSGSFSVELAHGSELGGTDSNVQLNGVTNGNILTYDGANTYWKNTDLTAGTGISVSKSVNGVLTVANTGVTSVTGTSPVVSSGGTTPAISMPAATGSVNGYLTSADWTTFNSKQPAGTYVTSVSGTTGRITSSGGTTPTIDLASGVATPGTTGSSTLIPVITVDTYGRVTSVTTASNPQGTVTSVTGTSPVASTGGATPAISLSSGYGDTLNPYASKTANYVLAAPNGIAGVPTFRAIVAADIPTLNQNTTGTASNVTGTVAIGNGGTGQTTAVSAFNALNPMTTTGDIIYEASPTTAARLGIGSTGQVLTVAGGIPSWATPTGSNITTLGLYENSATIAANYTIGTGNNAMSAGPITVNTGVTVTVPTGSTWTIV